MTHASVFSGIGGPEVAATMLGWENLFHCEINPFGRQVLQYWYPNAKSYDDITKTDFTEWRGKVNVLTGGFPCQPFSYAGKRGGEKDDRYLWPHMHRCINQIRPDWVVCENVAGIITMVEQGEVSELASQGTLFNEGDSVRRYQLRETFTIERICKDLESDGYSVQPILIPACAVGAPHRRDRVFIIGHRLSANGFSGMRESKERVQDGRQSKFTQSCNKSEIQYAPHTKDDRRVSEVSAQCSGIRREVFGNEERHEVHDGLNRPCSSQSTSNTNCSGARTPRQSEEVEGSRSNTNQQKSEWEAETEWNNRFYAILRNATDTSREGLERQDESRCGEGGQRLHLRRDSARCGSKTISDPDSHRGSEVDEHMESELADGAKPVSNGGQRNVADTAGYAGNTNGAGAELSEESRVSAQCETEPWRICAGIRQGDRPVGERWANFPSVSPVHRGNDGLPFDVDRLTLSFGKWRTEALKAYGNAIVPQVMYEIFRAIELTQLSLF